MTRVRTRRHFSRLLLLFSSSEVLHARYCLTLLLLGLTSLRTVLSCDEKTRPQSRDLNALSRYSEISRYSERRDLGAIPQWMQRRGNEASSMLGQSASGIVNDHHSDNSQMTKRAYTDDRRRSQRQAEHRSGDSVKKRQVSNEIVFESMKQSRKSAKNKLDDLIGKRDSVPQVTHHRSMDRETAREPGSQDYPSGADEASLTILGGPRQSNFLKIPVRDPRSGESALVKVSIDQPRLSEPSSVNHVTVLTRSRRDRDEDSSDGTKRTGLNVGNMLVGVPINRASERTNDYWSGRSARSNEAESSRASEHDIDFAVKHHDDLAGTRSGRKIAGFEAAQTRSDIGDTYVLDNRRSDGTRGFIEGMTDYYNGSDNFDFVGNESANSRANIDGNIDVIVFGTSVADYIEGSVASIEEQVAVDGVSEIGNRIETNSEYVDNTSDYDGMQIRSVDCDSACSAVNDNDASVRTKKLRDVKESNDNRENEDHPARISDVSTTPGNDSDVFADSEDVEASFTGFEGSQKFPVKINHSKSPPMVPQVEKFDWRHFGPHKETVLEEASTRYPSSTMLSDLPKSPSRDAPHRLGKTNVDISDVSELDRKDSRDEKVSENDEKRNDTRNESWLPGTSSGRRSPGLSGAKLEPDENFAVNTMMTTDGDVENASHGDDDSDANGEIDVTVPSVKSMEKTNITILGLFEMTYGSVPRPEGSSELEAAKLAVDRVNELDILKRFRLRLIYNDTKCDSGVAVDRFFHALYSTRKKHLMPFLLGTACSEVTETLAKIVPYWNVIQVSFGSTVPALSDSNEFPLFVRTVAPDSSHNPARIALIKHFGWDTVTALSQTGDMYSLAVNDLVTELEQANITCTATITFAENDYKEQLRTLKELDTRIIIGSFSSRLAQRVFCESTDKNIKELYTKSQTSNFDVKISNEDEQSLFASDALGTGINISSDYPLITDIHGSDIDITYAIDTKRRETRLKHMQTLLKTDIKKIATNVLEPRNSDEIVYIPVKETNRAGNRIQYEFSNTRISKGYFAAANDQMKKEENEENKEIENKTDREAESSIGSLNYSDVKDNISRPSNDARNDTLHDVNYFQEQNHDIIANVSGEPHFMKTDDEISSRMNMMIAGKHVTDAKVDSQSPQNRVDQENSESQEDELVKAANFGLRAMHDLYYIQEPKLYSMGLYLESDNPARFVAAFNDQSEEARDLARFGYATLQGTAMFSKRFPGRLPLEYLPLSRSAQRTLLEQQCPRRQPPQCPPASLRYRTSDGSCNNLQNLWWGSAMSTMQRYLPAEYHDGVQIIRRSTNGKALPNARDITNLIHEDRDIPLASVTHMLMQWGQFVDHDLTATGQSRGFNGTIPQCCLRGGIGFQPPEFTHPECLPIAVNSRDSFYGPLGVRCLEFLRSGPAPKENCEFGPREQLTQVTSYLDASMVYSSNAMQSDSLRIFRNGLLQYGRIQSRRPFFSKRESDLCKRGSLSTSCFRAGDGRLSEQPALTSLHVVFLRLHNRIATELADLNSHWSDEKLFQETRRIIGAVLQHITYREFLPIVLGPQVMKIFGLEALKSGYYEGYDPTVNPTVANSFSTAAYRFGHSLVQNSFVRFDSNHRPLLNNVSIHEEFSNPANLETAGSIERLLLGLVNQPCQRRDEFITDEMTNHLFQTSAFAFGMDLASLNIQRGRDHGLPAYVRWREPCGLSPIKTFEDLNKVMLPSVARKFRSLYSSVDDIDLFPAGLAEKSVVGGLVGPTFACIIGQQFSNLRRGDRFWYENSESESSFTAGQLQQIRRVTLAQILCRAVDDIKTVQPFVFLAADASKNQRVSCDDPAIRHFNLEFWAERSKLKFRINDELRTVKRTIADVDSDSISRKGENSRKRVNHNEPTKTTPKPLKNSINQNNRIVVKRPLGRPDNITIVVQNNAVNSPVFVNEGIYGSQIKIQQQPKQPITNINQAPSNYPIHRPQGKPISMTIPHSASFHAGYPYRPYTYDDPSNPNPLVYGYKSTGSSRDDVFYDNYSPSSPRPTLYTYYTNFQQQPSTTKLPEREIINGPTHYGSSYYANERPKPLINSGYHYTSNDKQSTSTQRASYSEPQLLSNMRPNHRPNYTPSNVESFGQNPDYNVAKPASLYSRPSEVHLQKPAYGALAHTSPANSQSGFRPNYQSYDTQKQPADAGHLQNNNFNNGPSGNYLTDRNKPQQEQWDSNKKRPSERPYDQDDPDAYQKRPNIKLSIYTTDSTNEAVSFNKPTNEYSQSWKTNSPSSAKNPIQSTLYGFASSPGITPSYEKSTIFTLEGSPDTSAAGDDRYSDTTPAYQRISTSTGNSWTSVSAYTKESSTRPSQSDSFNPHTSSFYQKLTSQPVYQNNDRSPPCSNESIDSPIVADSDKHDDSHGNPTKPFSLDDHILSVFYQTKEQSTPMWYSPETSTIDSQVNRRKESLPQKPTRVQSVTIVAETIETVHNPGHSGYITQHTSEVSSVPSLTQQAKNNVPPVKKPGQYYYEKNVLYRYPDETIEQIPRNNNNNYSADETKEILVEDRAAIVPEKVTMQTSIIDDSVTNSRVIQSNDESKLTTMSTLVINNHDNNGNDTVDDFQRAFSANIESVAPTDTPDRMNHWINPQEDLNLSSMLEMPEMPSDEITSARELPKPIKLRRHT